MLFLPENRDPELKNARFSLYIPIKKLNFDQIMNVEGRTMTERRVDKRLLAPVLMGFFIMGFCDIVAPVTNIISGEFPESRQGAVSFLPSMVFLWFLLLSTPVAALMNRIGRKKTAMIGYAFTIAGLLVPYAAGVGSALGWYFIGFGLPGIGNLTGSFLST
mgnify:FL=1